MQPLYPLTLTGRSVRLEPMGPEHAPALLAAAGESRESYRWTPVPHDLPAMSEYIAAALHDAERGSGVPFVTVDAPSGRIVGATRFCNIERWPWAGGVRAAPAPAAGAPDAVEIGWTWLAASAQRTAINTEAKLLLLTHAFTVWRVYRVTLKTDARNVKSRAAIERIGGTFDGIIRAHMPAADGGVRDTAFYTVVRAEWPAVSARLSREVEGRGLRVGERTPLSAEGL
jgi:RimJ/RimL family protein N-acetyltransferase